MSALELDCQNPAASDADRTIMLDCSPEAAPATLKLIAQLQSRLPRGLGSMRVVLVGDWTHAGAMLSLLDQAAIISPSSPLSRDDIGTLQEIVGVTRDGDENSPAAQRSLAAAIQYAGAYAIPHLATKGKASERLIAALAVEACRICSLQCDPTEVDFAATHLLGMTAGPFQLMDFYGTDRVLAMVETSPSTPIVEQQPVVARGALAAMVGAGYLGAESTRGGFYHYTGGLAKASEHLRNNSSGSNGSSSSSSLPLLAVNQAVYRTFLLQRPTPDAIAERLRLAMARECAAMLLDGTLATAADANLLTIAIGFPHTKGGVLAAIDATGVAKARDTMRAQAESFGPSFLPNQLWETMLSKRKSFATLDAATLELARKLDAMERSNATAEE